MGLTFMVFAALLLLDATPSPRRAPIDGIRLRLYPPRGILLLSPNPLLSSPLTSPLTSAHLLSSPIATISMQLSRPSRSRFSIRLSRPPTQVPGASCKRERYTPIVCISDLKTTKTPRQIPFISHPSSHFTFGSH